MNAMKLLFIYILTEFLSCVYCNSCSVNIDDILHQNNNDPIYIKNDMLHYPESEMVGQKKNVKLKWNEGERGIVACGDGNTIVGYETSEIEFECKPDNKLEDVSTKKDIVPKNLKCNQEIKPKVSTASESCETGKMIKIGFKTQHNFITLFEICYNFNSGSVRYTKHNINGEGIKVQPTSHDRVSTFLKDGLPYLTREGEPYLKSNQFDRFTDIVANTQSTPAFDNHNFLARGHLTPVADFTFNAWKRATMLFVNVAPEWQGINTCNWKRVENIARTMAFALNGDLEIITGIAEVLEMTNNKTNQLEELYLTTKTDQNQIITDRERRTGKKPRIDPTILQETEENLIKVPKYYWKVLKYGDQHIALITLNNPYAINEADVCTDICKQYNYPTEDKKNKNKGFHNFKGGRTYCCTGKDLVLAFPNDTPNYLNSYNNNNVLRYRDSSAIVPEPTECNYI